MSLWHIAWSYLWSRKFTTCLTILSVALSVALISAVLSLREEIRKRIEEEGQTFDIVVGSKGSPLSLVLSSVYFMQAARDPIPYSEYEFLKQDTEWVQAAYPISLGDNHEGFRLVGTSRDLMDHEYEHPYDNARTRLFNIADGRYFEKSMEAVIGYVAARETGLKIGDTFASTHNFYGGPDHSDDPYTVVGILKASDSPYDRAIFCNLDSIEETHEDEIEDMLAETGEHEPRVTAVLVQLHSPAQRLQYQGVLRERPNIIAPVPINEISDFFTQFIGPAKTLLMAVGYLVVVISALSILIGLYMAILQRKRDLAIMRALGASAPEIFGSVIIEAFWVTTLGIAFGWFLGNFVTYGLGLYTAREFGLMITSFGVSSEELTAFATVAMVGLVAGILPAWQAYDADVARDLADR
jgi:putative ABC transport system permease protein